MRSAAEMWTKTDLAKEIAKLHMPILVVQGTTDVQASPLDPKALAGANPAATLLVIEGMNHVLKTVPNEQNISSYSDPTLPVAPGLIRGISSFVIKAKGQRYSR